MSENNEDRPKPRVRSPLTIELLFNKASDRNGDPYYIGHDPGIALNLALGDYIILFFPGKDKLPPKMVLKPRRDVVSFEEDPHE